MSSESEGEAPFDESMYENDPDTLRIMISTDNHLGYGERDPVRSMDSFAAFEEVLYLAQKFNVDLVLLGGDLFHDNRPSRRTLFRTMEILRRYCLGPNPVRVELVSNYDFRSQGCNYLDPNYSVQMPLFSIHGNHDDPSRDQGGGELLAALDLLAVSNLVNYFGRQDQVDKVEIPPILLKKGDGTKLALYGLGSMRDERLNRMWEKQNVKFQRTAEEDYFNIFVLHQNRDLGRGSKNCIQESMIPEWIDLVIWGHEHECLIEFRESVVGTFRITQPGSSVATSLVAGEAIPKKVGILDIRGKQFRLHPIPLTQVRSFVLSELSLQEERHSLDPNDTNVEKKVERLLGEKVQLMVRKARKKRQEIIRDAQKAGSDAGDKDSPLKYKLQNPDEVLMRIKVEHSGFSTLNNQRFGAKYIGDVANPNDILLFHRKKDPKSGSTVKKKAVQPIAPDDLERTNMEDLVREHLFAPGGRLDLLREDRLSDALEEYVDKSRTSAISEAVEDLLKKTQNILVNKKKGGDDVRAMLAEEQEKPEVPEKENKSNGKPKETASKKRKQTVDSSDDETFGSSAPYRKPKKTASTKSSKASSQRAAARRDALDDSDDEVVMMQHPKPRSRSSRAKRKVDYSQDDDDNDEDSDAKIDEIEDSDDELIVEEPKKRKRAAPKKTPKRGTGRKAPAKKPALNRFEDDSDDDVEYVGGTSDMAANWGSAATKSQGW